MNISKKKAGEATRLIRKAITDKGVIVPKSCELCGENRSVWDNPKTFLSHVFDYPRPFIVPHHWRGYDYPLDVWFVCCSCNALLRGYHNGSISKEKLREIFTVYAPTVKAARLSNLSNDQVNYIIKKGGCPGAKRLSVLLSSDSILKNDPWFIPISLLPLGAHQK